MEVWDGTRLLGGKNGKVLGLPLAYACGLYTAHKPRKGKMKQGDSSQVARDVEGFVFAFNRFSEELGVCLQL